MYTNIWTPQPSYATVQSCFELRRPSKWTCTWNASVTACLAAVRWRLAGRRCPRFVRSATASCTSTVELALSSLWKLGPARDGEVRTCSWSSGGPRPEDNSCWRGREHLDALTSCFSRSRPTTVSGTSPLDPWVQGAATATVPPEVRSGTISHKFRETRFPFNLSLIFQAWKWHVYEIIPLMHTVFVGMGFTLRGPWK
jgi:hypothetical protein